MSGNRKTIDSQAALIQQLQALGPQAQPAGLFQAQPAGLSQAQPAGLFQTQPAVAVKAAQEERVEVKDTPAQRARLAREVWFL